MKKGLLSLLLLFSISVEAALCAPVLTLADKEEAIALGPFLEILEDPGAALTIADVVSEPVSGLFKPNRLAAPNFGFTDSAYWIRFRVRNAADNQARRLLALQYPHLDDIELYSPEPGGGFGKRRAGDRFEFSRREIGHRNFIFRIVVDAGDDPAVFYMRFKSRGPVQFPIALLSEAAFFENDRKEQAAFGVYYGMMFVMALYNFFLFFSVRDKSYLFYVLYIVSYSMVQMTYNGLAFEWLWPNHPGWANLAMPCLIGMTLFWILNFSKRFLHTAKYTPRLHKVILCLLGLSIFPVFLPFFNYAAGLRLGLVLMVATAAVLASASLSIVRKGYPPARYYLIAWFTFIGGFVLIVFRTFGLLPNIFLTEYGIQIGSAMEVTLLSLGLADRINQERKEKFAAQQNALRAKEEAVQNLRKVSEMKSEFLAITEKQVEERTRELNDTLRRVEEANRHIMDSLRYARLIQRSLLPNEEEIKRRFSDSFVIWRPREIVGGDIFLSEFFDDGTIIAVVDCTGHGAPGAFMTMIASSGLKRIIRDEGRRLPGDILKRLNFIVKTTLQQDKSYALSDDGLDASVCFLKPSENVLYFAGARLPLIVCENGNVNIVKGDRKSIGYRDSDLSFAFTNQTVHLRPNLCFYMSTDGITDQLGGPKGISFGKRRLGNIIGKNSGKPFERQKEILLDVFKQYRGDFDRMDDVTVIGFKI